MDHWAKDIYRWGIFSAEVYPRSSIAIQGTVWMSWISCPLNDLQYRWVNKFRTHGTVHNLNRKDTNRQSHSGQPKSSRTPHNVAAVRDSFVHSLSKSVHRRSQELGINWESVRRILIGGLHMYLYRTQIKQKLTSEEASDHVPVVLWQDWRRARLSWQCLVFRWGTFSVVRSRELWEQHLLR